MAFRNGNQHTTTKNGGIAEEESFLMVNPSKKSGFHDVEAGTDLLKAGKKMDDTDSESSEENGRHNWSRKAEYFLAMIGFCVGLGNVWRFPYVCMRNGGGAFLIPFFICLTLCGMPLFFAEVAIGQFVSKGVYHVWSISPLFRGIGISQVVLCIICAWYYSMIIAWTLIFVFNSFKSPLPWTLCGQDWNTPACRVPSGLRGVNLVNGSLSNGTTMTTLINVTGVGGVYEISNVTSNSTQIIKSSSEEFWLNNVLQLSPGLEHPDGLPWHTTVALLLANIVVFACIIKGVKSLGKVVYVTATLPYILLTVLIINGATLPGAIDGVLFYVKPDFSKLLTIQTWVEASLQVFYSLGPAYGGLITMASYNKFNNNCMRDAIILSFVCEGTSVYSGFAIFTVIGHMAHTLDVPMSNFTSTGPGLAFVVYPQAISYLPLPQLWGVLFFVMLFTLGLDSQFTMVETVLTTFNDLKPRFSQRWNIYIKIGCGCFMFVMSLPFATRGGMYYFQLFDWYFSAFTVIFIGILECILIGWIYGADRLLDDVALMIGYKPSYFFAFVWTFFTPTFLTVVMICTLLTYTAPVYEGYVFGSVAVFFGWCIALASFVPIPIYIVYKLLKTEGTLKQRVKKTLTPDEGWCPADNSLKEKYRVKSQQTPISTIRFPCMRQ